jgi:hypothetical protein
MPFGNRNIFYIKNLKKSLPKEKKIRYKRICVVDVFSAEKDLLFRDDQYTHRGAGKMYDNKLMDNFLSEFEVKCKEVGESKRKIDYNKTKPKMTSLEARRAVEELLDLKHYIDDVYDEVY